MTKQVRITKANEPTYWYAEHIGEVFDVEDEMQAPFRDGEKKYAVANDYENERMIDPDDCEVLGEKPAPAQADDVNSPAYYTSGRYETIEIIEELVEGYADSFVSYALGNCIKYLARAPYKHDDGGLTDLKKCRAYVDFAIDRIERKRTKGDD